MGKRKRAKKPPPKKKNAKLEKVFDCRYCGHEQVVTCRIDRLLSTGTITCSVCGATFSSPLNHLEEEIDLYAKWIDAADNLNKANEAANGDENDDEYANGGDGDGLPAEEDNEYAGEGKRGSLRHDEDDLGERAKGSRRGERRKRQEIDLREYEDDEEEDDI